MTAVDIDQTSLDVLSKKISEAGLAGRVKILNRSMFDMNFPDASFDVIWAEGSIFIIGFEKGLREWRRFLKPRGHLVVHEMVWLQPEPPPALRDYWERIYPGISDIPGNLQKITACGYDVIAHFALPEDIWWTVYYEPLEKRIRQLREKYADERDALALLDKEQHEIDLYKKYSNWYGSAFFVTEKK
jgi:SAM-dependent methyltransferase